MLYVTSIKRLTAFAILVTGTLASSEEGMRLEMLGEIEVVDLPRSQSRSQAIQSYIPEPLAFPHTFSVNGEAGVFMLRNDRTGKAVGLQMSGSDRVFEITPLLWKEMVNGDLGESERFSWSYGSIESSRAHASVEWSSFATDSASMEGVELPEFTFRKNGAYHSTGTSNRTLIAVSDSYPYTRMMVGGVCSGTQTTGGGKLSYTYQLPDGRLSSIVSRGGAERIAAMTVSVSTGTLPITIVYDDDESEGFLDEQFGEERRAAMEHAVGIWASQLSGTIPVEVRASIDPLDPGVLGQAGPIAWGVTEPEDVEFDYANTVYISSLANQIAGTDFFPTFGDIQITYSSSFINQFYFGLDGVVPPGKTYDFVTIVLHELAHGLGFLDGMAESGAYFFGAPFVFDQNLYHNGNNVVNLSQSDRAAANTSNALLWDGANAKSANDGSRIEMYAPATFSSGSSVSHWDSDIPFLSFMERAYFAAIHTVDPQLLGALEDMQWTRGNPFNIWALGQNIPENQRGLLDDPAGDGIENIWKYAVGLDALTVYDASVLFSYTVDNENGQLSLIYNSAKQSPDAVLTSEWTENLQLSDWDTNGISTVKIGETETQETWKSTIPSGSNGYARLKVSVEE